MKTLCNLLMCFVIFSFLAQHIYAQDLSGVWRGKVSQEEGGLYREYDFELQLTQKGNVIQGFSRISVDNYFANIRLEGIIRGNFIEFKEVKIIDQKIKRQAFWCLKKGLLMLSVHKGYEYLQGNWQGWSKEGSCTPGKLWVSRPAPKIMAKQYPALAKTDSVPSKEKQVNTQPEEKKETPNHSLLPSGIQAENTFQGRVTRESQPPVSIQHSELIIEIWDHKQIDGDIISLYLNEEIILEEYTLKSTRHQIKITLDPSKDNYLMLYAHNLGEITPNTAAISIDDGKEKQVRILRSDFDQSEVILLQYTQ